MPIELDDLIGLNLTTVRDMPIIDAEATARSVVKGNAEHTVTPAGMRHCQGGHTAMPNGRVLLMEAMRAVSYDPTDQTFTAEAGATWSQIHQVLHLHDRAPLVHQSSGHFTVGGSLAINCHGRDPGQGPLADTVVSLDVMDGSGNVKKNVQPGDDEFKLVIGGLGGGALILRARFRTTANIPLHEIKDSCGVKKYASGILPHLPNRKLASPAQLHFAWICCVPGGDFFDGVVYCDYIDANEEYKTSINPPVYEVGLKDEAWGTSEVLRAAWWASSRDDRMQGKFWQLIKSPGWGGGLGKDIQTRLNWMRAAVGFTMSRGEINKFGTDKDSVGMLHEVMVPIPELMRLLILGRNLFSDPNHRQHVRLLSCVVRPVQIQQNETFFCYAKDQPMACVTLDAQVLQTTVEGRRVPTQEAHRIFQRWIQQAIDLGGSFYLAYYPFAMQDQFDACYGGAADSWKKCRKNIDPYGRFLNQHLLHYGLV